MSCEEVKSRNHHMEIIPNNTSIHTNHFSIIFQEGCNINACANRSFNILLKVSGFTNRGEGI